MAALNLLVTWADLAGHGQLLGGRCYCPGTPARPWRWCRVNGTVTVSGLCIGHCWAPLPAGRSLQAKELPKGRKQPSDTELFMQLLKATSCHSVTWKILGFSESYGVIQGLVYKSSLASTTTVGLHLKLHILGITSTPPCSHWVVTVTVTVLWWALRRAPPAQACSSATRGRFQASLSLPVSLILGLSHKPCCR
jgi:hypothetical protein